jgi:predicted metal-dependent phosphoesterase TrpH
MDAPVRTIAVAAGALFAAALVTGTLADRVPARAPLILGGYRVLSADFHTHSSLWSDGALTPWGLAFEAARQRLDVIAVTGHNQTLDGRVARWASARMGGPLVIAGEEILGDERHYHLVALGITESVDFDQPAAGAVAEIHRQHGVAIAVHPTPESWPAWDARAASELDAAEICHPLIYQDANGQAQLEAFARRGSFAAIGSSDFHGVERMGLCRTYVFVHEATANGVLDALRAHRTVVYGRNGNAYGDPQLIALAAADGRLARDAGENAISWLDCCSRIAGLLALAGISIAAAFPRRLERLHAVKDPG